MGTRGWRGDDAATESWGIATAALPCTGQGMFDRIGVVVVVVGIGTVVVVVEVDEGTVVVVVVVSHGRDAPIAGATAQIDPTTTPSIATTNGAPWRNRSSRDALIRPIYSLTCAGH